jgi:hypothetical protein
MTEPTGAGAVKEEFFPAGARAVGVPSFRLVEHTRVRPGSILLAMLGVAGALCGFAYAMEHSRHAGVKPDGSDAGRSASAAADAKGADDDDPSQIDTIVLGDPGDAPMPARKNNHVSPVHPTIVIRLPRYGDQVGLIPDSPAGHLLYDWLAAFNHANAEALGKALPSLAPAGSVAAQMALRKHTGGFNLISAKEVQPGVLVFRLRDQTPEGTEVLGTLQVVPESSPAEVGSFSLRAFPVAKVGTTP